MKTKTRKTQPKPKTAPKSKRSRPTGPFLCSITFFVRLPNTKRETIAAVKREAATLLQGAKNVPVEFDARLYKQVLFADQPFMQK